MVGNNKTISTLAASPSEGLQDGTDAIHSGVIKGLESFAYDRMIIEHGGFAISSPGGSTLNTVTLTADIKYMFDGKMHTYDSNLTVNTVAAHGTHTRYDWVVLDYNDGGTPHIEIIQGTAASTPKVSDFNSDATNFDKFIPVALIAMVGGSDNGAARSFQMYTLDKNNLSLTVADEGAGAGTLIEAMSITSASGVTTFENKVSNADIVFQVKDGSSASQEVLRIDAADQRIGINASSPLSDLHIDSAGVTELRVSSTQDTQYSQANIICHTVNDYRGSGLYISADDDSGDAQDQTWAIGTAYSKDDLQIGFYQDKYDDIVNTANDPLDPTQGVVRITTGGNVGIGLFDGGDTPSAPEYMLHLASNTDQRPQLMLENRNTDENAGNEPEIIFKRHATPSAEGDHDSFDIGNIKWNARDHNGNYLTFCQLLGDIVDDSDGSEDGRLVFYMQAGGTNSEHFRVGGGAVQVNSQGLSNIDFVVESDTYNVINVDASNDSISIGGNDSAKIGFYGATPIVCATVAAGDIASSSEAMALANALVNLGLINVA
tara:strand:- start:2631 stop:4268 length:1638 start_codon:yes stop_codon:yes gene_type:complete